MIAIIGAGAWGTALATVARRAGHDVIIWAFERHVAESINTDRENPLYLPGHRLELGIEATTTLTDAVAAKEVLLVVPAQHLRKTIEPLRSLLPITTPLIVCSKGIEQGSLLLMSEVVSELFPENPTMVLSGPTFAAEAAAGLPTAITLAGTDIHAAQEVGQSIGSERFRPYSSDDVIGTQIGGAVKNVLAIACGIADGRQFGDNASAALITRGLLELTRLCIAKGGRPETMMGLTGLGDLVLTCTSKQSRNYSLGIALGQGNELAEILKNRQTVAEGIYTASAAAGLAKKLSIEMPITRAVDAILNRGVSIERLIDDLLARPLRAEAD